MKRTNVKLKNRLALVRMTIRQLAPSQLGQVNGGDEELITHMCPTKTCWGCCEYTESA
jgi:hypothetical protein